jgi:hypothetical protein
MFVIVVLTALVYRASDRMTIKSYIFQTNGFANQRVGELQDINDISAEDLRNKLIKKYVSEYFKVIPSETNVQNVVLYNLSTAEAYKQWANGEAKNIENMSAKNMFRIAYVPDDGITTLNKPVEYDYNDGKYTQLYYSVRYYTKTWAQPNKMALAPETHQGTLYIEAIFKPGIRNDIDVKNALKEGMDPALLFDFFVTNIGSKEI